jgi:hypothetical protein
MRINQGQAGASAVRDVEGIIAAWDRDGNETYRELAIRLIEVIRGEPSAERGGVRNDLPAKGSGGDGGLADL